MVDLKRQNTRVGDVRLAGIVTAYNFGFLHVTSNLWINNHRVHTRNLAPINWYLIDCLIKSPIASSDLMDGQSGEDNYK